MSARRRLDPSRSGVRTVLADLRAGRISPLYLLHGPEALLRDQLVRAIRQAVLPKEAADFNHDRFHWPETRAADLAAAAIRKPKATAARRVGVSSPERAMKTSTS